MSMIARRLLVPGMAVNALVLLLGIGAAVMVNAHTPASALILISAAFWLPAGQGCKAFVRRVEARPKKIRRSLQAYGRRQKMFRSQQAGSAPQTRIQEILKFPTLTLSPIHHCQ
jgi:hypothetical protein